MTRLAMLILAVSDLSVDRYVLIRAGRGKNEGEVEWRVNVKAPMMDKIRGGHLPRRGVGERPIYSMEHTSTATYREGDDAAESLGLALDRALQWLRAARTHVA